MKNLCPYKNAKPKVFMSNIAPENLSNVVIMKKEFSGNNYVAEYECKCLVCKKTFLVRMEANPYYETFVWQNPPCLNS